MGAAGRPSLFYMWTKFSFANFLSIWGHMSRKIVAGSLWGIGGWICFGILILNLTKLNRRNICFLTYANDLQLGVTWRHVTSRKSADISKNYFIEAVKHKTVQDPMTVSRTIWCNVVSFVKFSGESLFERINAKSRILCFFHVFGIYLWKLMF